MRVIDMKKNFVLGLSLTILSALGGGSMEYAIGAPASANNPPPQSQNRRHRTPHSQRRDAAVRLKHSSQVAHDQELNRQKARHGKKANGGVL